MRPKTADPQILLLFMKCVHYGVQDHWQLLSCEMAKNSDILKLDLVTSDHTNHDYKNNTFASTFLTYFGD
ncbi:hypothetical protein EB796_022793 [Bugula neritina]|uniref:Uncharacterized protein n=1 Tax=Bugula neritina TaxID=10212 RepID=A0A7J7J0A8_BUGNE|nr:hypothetical protein EB796_022793 [Bugula neritina]